MIRCVTLYIANDCRSEAVCTFIRFFLPICSVDLAHFRGRYFVGFRPLTFIHVVNTFDKILRVLDLHERFFFPLLNFRFSDALRYAAIGIGYIVYHSTYNVS